MALPSPSSSRSPHPRRQDPRLAVELPITLISVQPPLKLFTRDVSVRGLFVRTTKHLPERLLVRFRLVSPATGEVLLFHGMVASVIGPGDPEERLQGVGVELFAIDPEMRRAWWTLVQFVRDRREEIGERSGVRVTPPA